MHVFEQGELDTILQNEINSRIMEQASDLAEKLTELECKVANIDCYIIEIQSNDVEHSTYTEEAQDIFNIYYDQQVEELYNLLNAQLKLIQEIKN